MGLRSRAGRKVYRSNARQHAQEPDLLRTHPLEGRRLPRHPRASGTPELFDAVQEAFAPNRTKNNAQKRSYALRDFLYCAECGAKITAGTHKGHVYYRCTHGKGDCSQHSYIREDAAHRRGGTTILSRIAIDDEIVAGTRGGGRRGRLPEETRARARAATWKRPLRANRVRASSLLDRLLDGVIDSRGLPHEGRRARNVRLELWNCASWSSSEHFATICAGRSLGATRARAHIDFEPPRSRPSAELLAAVLCNATVEDGRIASYQYKGPFGLLDRSPEGALLSSMVGARGFEPLTPSASRKCSPPELSARM